MQLNCNANKSDATKAITAEEDGADAVSSAYGAAPRQRALARGKGKCVSYKTLRLEACKSAKTAFTSVSSRYPTRSKLLVTRGSLKREDLNGRLHGHIKTSQPSSVAGGGATGPPARVHRRRPCSRRRQPAVKARDEHRPAPPCRSTRLPVSGLRCTIPF
ncbi:hypothetical protein EVAR_16474_1 [Eumeta japonica]|uniref:Uncharacterized protein n=1 Tax=Eumeta variegata TaxID=151549 RepID=A0A4C1ULP1_EUMVA|nr:hypothetical protein EVAR_16474_1 [Eumeta japonica]